MTLRPAPVSGGPDLPFSQDLFQFVNIPLSLQSRPTLMQQVSDIGREGHRCLLRDWTFAILDNTPIVPMAQSSFPFVTSPAPLHPVVVRLATRRHSAYLDYGVYDCFRYVPRARTAARKLEQQRVRVLGFLVQMSEAKVRALTGADDATLECMRNHLAKIGFGFDMRIPWWNRAYAAFYARVGITTPFPSLG